MDAGLAYASDESGAWEVYVQAFPTTGGKVRISTSGGTQPKWRRDGKEIFYLAADRNLMVARVGQQGPADIGAPMALFRLGPPASTAFFAGEYAVAADGQRFLINRAVEGFTPPVTVVLNWPAGLRR